MHILFHIKIFLGRPPKAKSTCTMCNESKHPLNYVLPTQNGKKEFCSVNCLTEFRKEYVKVIIAVYIKIILIQLIIISRLIKVTKRLCY